MLKRNDLWESLRRDIQAAVAAAGVSVTSGSNGIDTVAILGNSIYGNGGLGIDLGGNGVNLNDPGDTDSGPNNVQNFPVITAATLPAATSKLWAPSTASPAPPFIWNSSATR